MKWIAVAALAALLYACTTIIVNTGTGTASSDVDTTVRRDKTTDKGDR